MATDRRKLSYQQWLIRASLVQFAQTAQTYRI
jgi:hypothetical protein